MAGILPEKLKYLQNVQKHMSEHMILAGIVPNWAKEPQKVKNMSDFFT